MKNKILPIVLCVLIVLVVVTFGGFIGFLFVQSQMTPEYTLYIGLNDKDTGDAAYTYKEAAAIVDSVCKKYFDGYTLYPASGRWFDPSGNFVHENTIVCHIITDADEETIGKTVDELLEVLNQYSIMVEAKMALAAEITRR